MKVIEIAFKLIYEITLSFMFIRVFFINKIKTPLFCRLLIILFSITSRARITLAGLNWVFLAVVIMFLGGIIVVFIYASSLNFRKKNILQNTRAKLLRRVIISLGLILLFNSFRVKAVVFSSYRVYVSQRVSILIFMATYLLVILLIVVKIIQFNEGPLKTYFS